jgi:hypothetical protein
MYTVYILDKLEKLVSWASQAGQAGPGELGHELELAAGKLGQAAKFII